jgi:hypothetical protein
MKKWFLFVLLSLLAAGCKNNQPTPANLQAQIYELSTLVSSLNAKIDAINYQEKAIFTPSNIMNGNFPVLTSYGYFPVCLENLKKEAGGYKAVFSIVNPYSIPFSNPSLLITWGDKMQYFHVF